MEFGDVAVTDFEVTDIIVRYVGFGKIGSGKDDFVVVVVKINNAFDEDCRQRFVRYIYFMEVSVLNGEEIIRRIVEDLDFAKIISEFPGNIDAFGNIFDI